MSFLVILHAVICVIVVAVVLLQPGKSDMGISFGSNSQSIFGSKAASNFLTKLTSICAALFLFTSFFLARQWVVSSSTSVIPETASEQTSETGGVGGISAESSSAPAPTPEEPAKK